MDASLRFRRRDALHSMDAAFVTQLPKNGFAADFENDFLQAAEFRRTRFHVFNLQSCRFRVAGVHPVQIGRENRRLASARAGANFNDRVAVLVFIRWKQGDLHFSLKFSDAFFELGNFFLRHLGKIAVGGIGKIAIVRQLGARRR